MKKTVLREYAKLIVRCGINVQKGQEVMVYADLDQPEFVQMVVEEAYKRKAKKVSVECPLQVQIFMFLCERFPSCQRCP